MEHKVQIYNSLTRRKELFIPLNPPLVGLYVCGPTVYGDAHLGHARPAITFDLVFRYLKHLGYKVRYVRNITDVGHLENDADEGEDKIGRKARLEQLEPMEVVQYYTDRYHENMAQLNVLKPSIEPRASGHIIEQIELVKRIMEEGYAYEVNGSVYFDVEKYNKHHHYGKLSGRVLDDLVSNTRSLEGQDEKRSSFDFAIWKKAQPEHIMRWPAPWSDGFPGWHTECSAMSVRYLGEVFDIHGGGMDLLFPHHEAEIAQSTAAMGHETVRIWMHNNMITLNGQKMGKSLGNAISLFDFFTGNHPLLEMPYTPMVIRFFILQAHYRSTLDFSNEALQAAERGMKRLFAAARALNALKPSATSSENIPALIERCYEAMNDDFNSPVLIAHLFDAVRIINSAKDDTASLTQQDIDLLQTLFQDFMVDVLGLKDESATGSESLVAGLVESMLELRRESRVRKDFATSDKIRDTLANLGVVVKDTKEGSEWSLE